MRIAVHNRREVGSTCRQRCHRYLGAQSHTVAEIHFTQQGHCGTQKRWNRCQYRGAAAHDPAGLSIQTSAGWDNNALLMACVCCKASNNQAMAEDYSFLNICIFLFWKFNFYRRCHLLHTDDCWLSKGTALLVFVSCMTASWSSWRRLVQLSEKRCHPNTATSSYLF